MTPELTDLVRRLREKAQILRNPLGRTSINAISAAQIGDMMDEAADAIEALASAADAMPLSAYTPDPNGCAIQRILYALEKLAAAKDDQYTSDETFADEALERLARAADDAMLDGGCDD